MSIPAHVAHLAGDACGEAALIVLSRFGEHSYRLDPWGRMYYRLEALNACTLPASVTILGRERTIVSGGVLLAPATSPERQLFQSYGTAALRLLHTDPAGTRPEPCYISTYPYRFEGASRFAMGDRPHVYGAGELEGGTLTLRVDGNSAHEAWELTFQEAPGDPIETHWSGALFSWAIAGPQFTTPAGVAIEPGPMLRLVSQLFLAPFRLMIPLRRFRASRRVRAAWRSKP